jgi:hypothetical protein
MFHPPRHETRRRLPPDPGVERQPREEHRLRAAVEPVRLGVASVVIVVGAAVVRRHERPVARRVRRARHPRRRIAGVRRVRRRRLRAVQIAEHVPEPRLAAVEELPAIVVLVERRRPEERRGRVEHLDVRIDELPRVRRVARRLERRRAHRVARVHHRELVLEAVLARRILETVCRNADRRAAVREQPDDELRDDDVPEARADELVLLVLLLVDVRRFGGRRCAGLRHRRRCAVVGEGIGGARGERRQTDGGQYSAEATVSHGGTSVCQRGTGVRLGVPGYSPRRRAGSTVANVRLAAC